MFRIFNIFKTYDTNTLMISKTFFKLRMRSERWRQRKNVTQVQGYLTKSRCIRRKSLDIAFQPRRLMEASNLVVYLPSVFPSWWFAGPSCCFGIPAATTPSALGLASSLHDLLVRCQLNEVSTYWIWRPFSCSLACWTQSTCKNLNENGR